LKADLHTESKGSNTIHCSNNLHTCVLSVLGPKKGQNHMPLLAHIQLANQESETQTRPCPELKWGHDQFVQVPILKLAYQQAQA